MKRPLIFSTIFFNIKNEYTTRIQVFVMCFNGMIQYQIQLRISLVLYLNKYLLEYIFM